MVTLPLITDFLLEIYLLTEDCNYPFIGICQDQEAFYLWLQRGPEGVPFLVVNRVRGFVATRFAAQLQGGKVIEMPFGEGESVPAPTVFVERN